MSHLSPYPMPWASGNRGCPCIQHQAASLWPEWWCRSSDTWLSPRGHSHSLGLRSAKSVKKKQKTGVLQATGKGLNTSCFPCLLMLCGYNHSTFAWHNCCEQVYLWICVQSKLWSALFGKRLWLRLGSSWVASWLDHDLSQCWSFMFNLELISWSIRQVVRLPYFCSWLDNVCARIGGCN